MAKALTKRKIGSDEKTSTYSNSLRDNFVNILRNNVYADASQKAEEEFARQQQEYEQALYGTQPQVARTGKTLSKPIPQFAEGGPFKNYDELSGFASAPSMNFDNGDVKIWFDPTTGQRHIVSEGTDENVGKFFYQNGLEQAEVSDISNLYSISKGEDNKFNLSQYQKPTEATWKDYEWNSPEVQKPIAVGTNPSQQRAVNPFGETTAQGIPFGQGNMKMKFDSGAKIKVNPFTGKVRMNEKFLNTAFNPDGTRVTNPNLGRLKRASGLTAQNMYALNQMQGVPQQLPQQQDGGYVLEQDLRLANQFLNPITRGLDALGNRIEEGSEWVDSINQNAAMQNVRSSESGYFTDNFGNEGYGKYNPYAVGKKGCLVKKKKL